jgi:hypothetical protein
MERNLMAKEEIGNLGLDEKAVYQRISIAPEDTKERTGFIAGTGVQASSKRFFPWSSK